MSTYIAGITNSVSAPPHTSPPITAMPIEMRLSAPAPSASAIGSVPRIVASVVMRIGRRRAAAASRTATSARRRARRAALVRELDDQNAVLGDQPHQHDQPDLRKDVQRLAEVPEREQRAGERERHREQDHERIEEALELRREHEIDQHEREHDTQPSDEELSTKSRAEPVSVVVKRSSSVFAATVSIAAMPSLRLRPGASVPDTVAAT